LLPRVAGPSQPTYRVLKGRPVTKYADHLLSWTLCTCSHVSVID
jgi:hypothetical protein